MAIDSGARARLDFLDAARGTAALVVLLEHGLHTCVLDYLAFSRANVIIGQAAVLVFFLVSGFVVPMSLEGGHFARFWVRRFFRLFPVYWLSIAVALAYAIAGGRGLAVPLADTGTWAANVFLLQSWLKRPHVWEVFWTLPYELCLYAACSLLVAGRVLDRFGVRHFVGIVGVVTVAGMWRAAVEGKPSHVDGVRQSVIFCCLIGLLAYRYATGRVGRAAFYGALGTLAASIVLVWSVNRLLFPADVSPTELARVAGLGGLAVAFFLALLEARHRRMPAVACWLGRRSYPIYLLHPFVVLLVPISWPAWVFMPCLVAGTLLLAAAAHRLVERPGIALGRWLELQAETVRGLLRTRRWKVGIRIRGVLAVGRWR